MQIARQKLPQLAILRKPRVLIVDDEVRVHEYATISFREFNRWHAANPSQARKLFAQQSQNGRRKKPFDLVSCDINMPVDLPAGITLHLPIGIELMAQIHEKFPSIKLICHSDDEEMAKKVPFATFVLKTYPSETFVDTKFIADEAFLRAAALDALKIPSNISLTDVLSIAINMPPLYTLRDLNLPVTIAHYTEEARRVHAEVERERAFLSGPDISEADLLRFTAELAVKILDKLLPLFAFARAGPEYLDEQVLVNLVRYVTAPELPAIGSAQRRMRA